ncbi:nucleotidyltransferase domain-containing protein, partial [Bacteroidota bacterium]
MMNRKELTYKVKQSIKSVDPDARVILFGSRARGDSNKTSDWDFLVLTSRQADEYIKRQIRDRVLDTELEAEQVISTVIFSKEKWSEYQITP